MTVGRVAAFLMLSSLLPPDALHAKDEKPEVPKVTVEDLRKNPEKYHGKVVQIEGVLESGPTGSTQTQVIRYYLRLAKADALAITTYRNPAVSKGDRVRITGTFRYSTSPSGALNLGLKTQGPDGKVEKLPKKKE